MKSFFNKINPKKRTIKEPLPFEKDAVPVQSEQRTISRLPNSLLRSNSIEYKSQSRPDKLEPSPNSINIVINHGKGFQIGDSTTINVAQGGAVNFGTKGYLAGIRNLGNAKDMEDDCSDLEDITDVLTEKVMWIISEAVTGDWKIFGRKLDIPDSILDEYETENVGKPKLATFEMLINFQKQHPATSVGYIAAILRESQQHEALKALKRI